MQALYDGISAYQWKTAAVFYDGSEGKDGSQGLQKLYTAL